MADTRKVKSKIDKVNMREVIRKNIHKVININEALNFHRITPRKACWLKELIINNI